MRPSPGRCAGTTRFIPAYTGNAPCLPPLYFRYAVYPRVYGECLRSTQDCRVGFGLSPRIRGMQCQTVYSAPPTRFIPAYTGNASSSPVGVLILTVYPRVYGECTRKFMPKSSRIGLSPRIRGMPAPTARPARRVRFIPAYTGNA